MWHIRPLGISVFYSFLVASGVTLGKPKGFHGGFKIKKGVNKYSLLIKNIISKLNYFTKLNSIFTSFLNSPIIVVGVMKFILLSLILDFVFEIPEPPPEFS